MILAYPTGDRSKALEVARELERAGIDGVAMAGRIAVGRHRVLGKGKSSMVLICEAEGEVVAAKVRRIDSPTPDMVMEATMLRAANSAGVGPKLLGWSANSIVMELLVGRSLAAFLSAAGPRAGTSVRVMLSALDKARALDAAGIDHGELHDPREHVQVVCGEPEIIDFGSASAARRPSNVTSLASAIVRLTGRMPDGRLIGALRAYKEEMSDERYREILESLGLRRAAPCGR